MDTTKIIELFIDDDYEDAGIEAISLVSRPAHDETWMAFKSDCSCGTHKMESDSDDSYSPYTIVDGNFCNNHPNLATLGEPSGQLESEGWEIVRVERMTPQVIHKMNQHKFSSPNAESELDKETYRVRYKYIGPRDSKTREFCEQMLSFNRVYRIEDIDELTDSIANPDFGFYEIFTWRGSFNCRHQWVRLIYKKEGTIINSGSSSRGLEDTQGLGSNLQPDTRTEATINSKNPENQWKPGQPRTGNFAGEKISIDYDDTLSTDRGLTLAKELISKGVTLYIISARQDKEPMLKRAEELGIPVSRVYATGSNKAKIEKIKELGIKKHHDNNKDVVEELGSIGEQFAGLEDACWEGYEAIGLKDDGTPNCVPIKMTEDDFAESISDYPEGVKTLAKAAVDYAEKNGWGSCGTAVGKTRASQLANGEPISVDTLKRMYSYLSRHKADLTSSKSYEDGCGKLMYDAWGGEAGLTYAERKLKQLENMKMVFSVIDEEKKIIVGAAMVPNKMIHRYDDLGNLYYVFFSKESIKKMADKFLKEKRTDETSIEHNGLKLGSQKVFITESWVSEDPIYDKSHKYGFELPAGTWFVSMKVNDDKVWKLIKDKALTGYSVEGLFAEKSVFSKEDKQINQITKLLKSITDYDK